MKVEVITDLAQEPVTLEGAKKMCRITGNGHDFEIGGLIKSARVFMEWQLNMSLGEKEYKVTIDRELSKDELPYGPVTEITAEGEDDGVYTYEYKAGIVCPEDIRQGIYFLVKHWFDIDDVSAELPRALQTLIASKTLRV